MNTVVSATSSPASIKTPKVIHLKVVYYGPPQSGKTANLQTLQRHFRRAPGTKPGQLQSFAAKTNRSLQLDLLSLEVPVNRDYRARISLYTAPGAAGQQATRQLVLKGVNGIVFVADSRYEMMPQNLALLRELTQNLAAEGLDPQAIPMVFQYSKQDLPGVAPKEYLDFALNHRSPPMPSLLATATKPDGVFSTLNAISRQLVSKALKRF